MKQIQYAVIVLLLSSHNQIMAMGTSSKKNMQEMPSSEVEIDSCTMSNLNKQVRIIKTDQSLYFRVEISSSQDRNKDKISNESFVESIESSDAKQCMLEGFTGLSCGTSSFSIDQNVCAGSYVLESFLFTYNKEKIKFYLEKYQVYKTDRRAARQFPVLDSYPKKDMGLVTFQELTNDNDAMYKFRQNFWSFLYDKKTHLLK